MVILFLSVRRRDRYVSEILEERNRNRGEKYKCRVFGESVSRKSACGMSARLHKCEK